MKAHFLICTCQHRLEKMQTPELLTYKAEPPSVLLRRRIGRGLGSEHQVNPFLDSGVQRSNRLSVESGRSGQLCSTDTAAQLEVSSD